MSTPDPRTGQPSVRPCTQKFPDAARWFRLLLRFVLRPLLALRYRIRAEGLEDVRRNDDGRGILFLPSHSALVDPLVLYSLLPDYLPRPFADARQVELPVVRSFIAPLRPIVIPDPKTHRRAALPHIRAALHEASEALNRGDALLLYPAGRLTRDGEEHLGANSGAHEVRNGAPGCRVVLVCIRGLWGSSFSAATCGQGQTPLFFRVLLDGLARLAANGLLFMPRREVRVRFVELSPADLPGTGVLPFNRALEELYHAVPQPLEQVPDYFWKRP